MNISKHETQSLYPSLLHPRDSKPSSFDSATVCGSACPGGRLRGYPEVTGSAACLKKIVRVAANQRHSSNMDCKQTSVWPSTKKSAIVDMWKVPGTLLLVMLAPCIILRIPRSSSRMSCSIRQAINNSDGPGGWSFPHIAIWFKAQSEMWKSMKSSSVNSFGFGYNTAFVRFPVSLSLPMVKLVLGLIRHCTGCLQICNDGQLLHDLGKQNHRKTTRKVF